MAQFVIPRSRPLQRLVLLLILVGGFTLRVWNLNFDQGLLTHPDERSTVCFIAPLISWPKAMDEFGDPDRSPLNPLWNRMEQRPTNFTYGHFPLYLGVLMGELMHRVAPTAERMGMPTGASEMMARANQPCAGIAIAGRFLIALLDTWTIFLLYLLGKRALGPGAGLLAAAFYAFTAQAVQLAHFFAMDPASTTFTVLAVLGGVKMAQERTMGAALLTGLGAGLAVASKFSALPVMAVPVTAVALWIAAAHRELSRETARSQVRALGALVVAFVVMGVTFFVASPYAVLDWERFVKATLVDQGQMVRGVADFPFTRQYRNTLPYVYFVQQQVQWGLGWPLGLLSLGGTLVAAVGLVWTLFRLGKAWWFGRLNALTLGRVEMANVVVWSWVAPYFGITGAFLAKFNRYMSPVLPFAVLFGAGLLWLGWRWGSARASLDVRSVQWRRGAMALVGGSVLAAAMVWSVAYVNGIHGREHTWISASRWIYQNAPSGSVLLWELWDDQLPKSLPEPGMDMGSAGLRNIDWSPYEEDTAEKYALLKQKLNEANFVVYSSKRIYDSVDELPERYPMTNLYYQAMWDGRLGFELVAEFTSPPRLFGWVVEDRHADESWSLYDHPQVSVFRKVRQLSDAEYDALFGRVWEEAVPYYRGKDSPISPFLQLLGLGSQPGSERQGLIGALVSMLSRGESQLTATSPQNRSDLLFDEPLANLPLVDNYRWNVWASEQTLLSVLVWWLVVAMLGWFAWPVCFALFAPFLDRGYLFSRTMGWLMAGWLLWVLASVNALHNTVVNSWLMAGVVGIVGAGLAWRQRRAMQDFLAARWKLLLVEEALVAAAFGLFVLVRLVNPDIWQPWYGGEKFMEFAFLNGILRSPTFPPVDPHFAGGYINYYYFGIYLVGYLIKLTGIYAEVAFNLTIPLLFALTVANAFAVTHTAWGVWQAKSAWQRGMLPALLGPFLVTLIGNLDGYAQIVRQLSDRSPVQLQSALPGVTWLVEGIGGLMQVATGQSSLPVYDFWAPSRVIPATINEFPYWSFLFADLHPHLIGIPLSLFFLGALFSLLMQYAEFWNGARRQGIALIAALSFLLGGLISVNLWELPTYFGLAILTLLVGEFRYFGHARLLRVGIVAVTLLAAALLFYLPFFVNFVNVGASGVGLVREGDDLGLWLLLWGGLGFVVISWLVWRIYGAGLPGTSRMPRGGSVGALPYEAVEPSSAFEASIEANDELDYDDGGWDDPIGLAEEDGDIPPEESAHARAYRPHPPGRVGVPRVVGQSLRRFERLPRLWYLHQRLVQRPTLSYLLGLAAIPLMLGLAVVAWLVDRSVLALCLAVLAVALPLLWRREREADASDQLATMLAITGVLLLGGTQVFYLKDFLQGSDYYRMNTLFKFFNQVWVLWALAGAIALPRLWAAARRKNELFAAAAVERDELQRNVVEALDEAQTLLPAPNTHPLARPRRRWGALWQVATVLVLAASSVFVIFGTPSRLSQRFVGWVPPFGTLNGMAYMQHGRYAWPNDGHWIDLSYDYLAIQWLLKNVRGNLVIAESAEVDYYRAGGTRIASMTGLSGLRGSHVSEQRYGEDVGMRDGLHREFWATTSVERTEELIRELEIALIYAGQLERFHHPEGVQKLVKMASEGRLVVLYENDGVVIYAVPDRVVLSADGKYQPVPMPAQLPLPRMGWRAPRLLAATKN